MAFSIDGFNLTITDPINSYGKKLRSKRCLEKLGIEFTSLHILRRVDLNENLGRVCRKGSVEAEEPQWKLNGSSSDTNISVQASHEF